MTNSETTPSSECLCDYDFVNGYRLNIVCPKHDLAGRAEMQAKLDEAEADSTEARTEMNKMSSVAKRMMGERDAAKVALEEATDQVAILKKDLSATAEAGARFTNRAIAAELALEEAGDLIRELTKMCEEYRKANDT